MDNRAQEYEKREDDLINTKIAAQALVEPFNGLEERVQLLHGGLSWLSNK